VPDSPENNCRKKTQKLWQLSCSVNDEVNSSMLCTLRIEFAVHFVLYGKCSAINIALQNNQMLVVYIALL